MYEKIIKRVLDIVLSIVLLITLSPIVIIIGIIVYIGMGSPIIFNQERIGYKEQHFMLYKFRSMTNAKEEDGELLDEQKRLTKLGIFLRSTSLDELPELLNIIKGEMSFVGPRPLPAYYMPFYKDNERVRHSVRGGLIPPDVLSRKTVPTWEEQFNYDTYYVENVSFILDLKVIFSTFIIIVKRIIGNYGAEDRPHLSEERAEIMQSIF